jgi:hypothetical protein
MNMKVAICAIIKNEHRYLKEWVEHYLNLGFDEVFLGEDASSRSHQTIIDEISSNKVKMVKLSNSAARTNIQLNLYQKYFEKNKNKFDWIAFFDIDEFLILENETLHQFLSDYESYDGVCLAWKYYNANGYIKTPEGNVVDNYTNCFCSPINDCQVKSIVNCHNIQNIEFIHAASHNCVDVFKNYSFKSSLFGMGYAIPKYWHRAWINHYFTKSWEEWVQRMIRGNMQNNYRTLDTFFEYNPDLQGRQKELTIEAAKLASSFANTRIFSKKYSLYSDKYINELKESFFERIGMQSQNSHSEAT